MAKAKVIEILRGIKHGNYVAKDPLGHVLLTMEDIRDALITFFEVAIEDERGIPKGYLYIDEEGRLAYLPYHTHPYIES